MEIYPLSFLPYYTYPLTSSQPITFDSNYIQNILALNVLDYISIDQFNSNPLFAQVDTFHQNVGFIQTAATAIEKMLTLIDNLKDAPDALNTLQEELNDIVKNTTFNDIPVFSQTLDIDGEKLDLSIPLFNPDEISIEEYEKLLQDKYDNFIDVLKNMSLKLPFENEFNMQDFLQIVNQYSLLSAFNLQNSTLAKDFLFLL